MALRALGICVVMVASLAFDGCALTRDGTWRAVADDGAFDDGSAARRLSYFDDELSAALPQGGKQLHGLRIEQECRTLRRMCRVADVPDRALHVRTEIIWNSRWFLLSVWPTVSWRSWRQGIRSRCRDGRIDDPIRWHSSTEITLGERGTGSRTGHRIDNWLGVLCIRKIEFVYPPGWDDGTGPYRYHSAHVIVTNGTHAVLVQAEPVRFARQVAREYVRRLERGT